MEIMFISGQEGMGLMDKWRGGSRRDYKQFFHFNRRKKRNILAKMQVSGWKLEEVLSSVSIFSGKQNTKQTSEKEEGRGGAGCLKKKGCKQIV